jgi:hypothetical protein
VSRFADPNAVDTFEVACPCPGTPHDEDTITHRTELGAGELESVGQYGWQRGNSQDFGFYDEAAAMSFLVTKAVTRWTLVDGEGKGLPITIRNAELLPGAIRSELRSRLEAAAEWEAGGPAPNAPGVPSRSTSRASASRTPTSRRRR